MTRANGYVGQAGGLDGSCASLSTGEPGGTPGGEGHGTSADVRTRVSLRVEGPGGFGGGRSGGWGGPDGLTGDSNEGLVMLPWPCMAEAVTSAQVGALLATVHLTPARATTSVWVAARTTKGSNDFSSTSNLFGAG
jgi:hypothetical protein